MECPASKLYLCRCPLHKGVIEQNGLAYYPTSGLLMMDGSLYVPILSVRGRHYVDAVMGALASGAIDRSQHFIYSGRICTNLATTVTNPRTGAFELAWWTVFSYCRPLFTIQRWVRKKLMWRRRQRHLALAMALHPRLGGASQLGALGQDNLEALCSLC